MNILIAENLKKYYQMGENVVKALDGVSLSVRQGEFLAIVGESGSGKSTLLHMLGGLDWPTSGKVMIGQKDISSMDKDELTIFRRRKIGFVFQNYNLLPLMNVYENIVLPIKLDGIRPEKRHVNEIIEMLGLGDKRSAMPSQLSGGQQQRVALARALAAKPAHHSGGRAYRQSGQQDQPGCAGTDQDFQRTFRADGGNDYSQS